jgi:glycosyltransferase involved in cell wall biosynthesis
MSLPQNQLIVISPSGNYYGSEQVLHDFLDHTTQVFDVYVPSKSKFYHILHENTSHKLFTFRNVQLLYATIFFKLLRSNVQSVYVNEAGHVRWVLLLAKFFKKRQFTIHVRIVEDIERLPNIKLSNVSFVTISKFMANQISKDLMPITVIDSYAMQNFHFTPEVNNDTIQISVIGRISMFKGFDRVVRFCIYLNENWSSSTRINFNFYGTATGSSNVRNGINALKMLNKIQVFFHGFRVKKDIYNHTHIVLHMADSEPLGRIFFEAIDMNIPLVGFNAGGIGELARMTDLTDTLIAPNAHNWEDKMMHVITRIFHDYDRFVEQVKVSKKRHANLFNQETYNSKLYEILKI